MNTGESDVSTTYRAPYSPKPMAVDPDSVSALKNTYATCVYTPHQHEELLRGALRHTGGVVKLTAYMTDMKDWEMSHRVRREFARMVDERHKLVMDPIIMLSE